MDWPQEAASSQTPPATGSVQPASHHEQQEFCHTRLTYRDGRALKAVKVFTVSDESIYLIVHHVPALNLGVELLALCQKYGEIHEQKILHDYPCEQFTEVHLVKFKRPQSARLAKLKLDNFNFHGAVLHVHYAPELEMLEETRAKLENRRREVSYRLWRNAKDLEEEAATLKRKWEQLEKPEPEEVVKPKKPKKSYGPRLNPFQ